MVGVGVGGGGAMVGEGRGGGGGGVGGLKEDARECSPGGVLAGLASPCVFSVDF